MLVTYIDHMGNDLSVVNAARVSFGKRSESDGYSFVHGYGEGLGVQVPNLFEQDQSLIAFLARGCTSGDWSNLVAEVAEEGSDVAGGWRGTDELEDILNHIRKIPSHWSPFAHTAISLHLKMPIFVARQIMKHTTGIEYNEVSRRYVDSEPEFYVPDVWRKKADNLKQGSSDEAVDFSEEFLLKDWVETYASDSLCLYTNMIEVGVAPEQARMVLPQSMYTEVIATGNLYAWANLYIQRTDSHAQKETQDLAKQIGEIIQPLYPVSWEALCS